MVNKKKTLGLGRGLGALIPQSQPIVPAVRHAAAAVTEEEAHAGSAFEVAIDRIDANPDQPRRVFSHAELEELMESIKEHGIIQPLVVTPSAEGRFILVAGERRYRASKMLGLVKVPVVVRKVDSGQDRLVLALIENLQREDLNPIEEARAYERLTDEFGFTQDQVAKSVGKGRSTVANAIRLLGLPEEIQSAISTGVIPWGSARAILALPDNKSRLAYFRKFTDRKLTTREIENDMKIASGKGRRDSVAAAIEEDLQHNFGTKVEVKRKGAVGSISMSFYSEEEMNELVRRLKNS
jgi:ParB family chromosome partitioning protein